MKRLFFYFIILSVLFFARPALAAVFSFDALSNQVRVGNEFAIDLMLDTEMKEINAVEAKVLFPADVLELKEISDGNSLINIWAQKPEFSKDASEQVGVVSLAGVIPGGYNGYLGKRKIISLIFQAKNNGASSVLITEAKALINDGLGTAAPVTSTNWQFSISADAPAVGNALIKDQERPEDFIIHLSKDANIFNGQWFVVFATQDKKSGVDHYEVAEDKTNVGVEYNKLNWHRAGSPYLLSDQSLGNFVYVKAVDNRGNERVAMLSSAPIKKGYKIYLFWGIIGLSLIWLLLRRKIWRKQQN